MTTYGKANCVQAPKANIRLKTSIRKRLASQLGVPIDALRKAERECDGRIWLVQPEAGSTSKVMESRIELHVKTDNYDAIHLFPTHYFVGYIE